MIRFGFGFHADWLVVLPLASILWEGDEGITITIGWLNFSLCLNIKNSNENL